MVIRAMAIFAREDALIETTTTTTARARPNGSTAQPRRVRTRVQQPYDYVVYGRLDSRAAVALLSVLRAKGLRSARVEESPSLVLELIARTGSEAGPYLRTGEGFVLARLHAILDWLERVHPEPALLPPTDEPARRLCARILESWIESWLPLWPRRSWRSLEKLSAHLEASGFLLGRQPTRPDWLLAAWLEAEVLPRPHARTHLLRHAPRLVDLGAELLVGPVGVGWAAGMERAADDAIPISLLPVLEEIAGDFHGYLAQNRAALEQGRSRFALDLGLIGRRVLPVERESEVRRVEIGRELLALPAASRRAVHRLLDPIGLHRVYLPPSALEELDPADPRSL